MRKVRKIYHEKEAPRAIPAETTIARYTGAGRASIAVGEHRVIVVLVNVLASRHFDARISNCGGLMKIRSSWIQAQRPAAS